MRTKEQKIFYYNQEAIYKRKIEEFETAEEKVAWLLHNNSHLRNCDKCLIKAYELQVDRYNGSLDSEEIHRLTSSETIRRVRQKLNELGLFLPTDGNVVERRKVCEKAVKDWSLL
jgi:hypothetical protein